MIPLGDSKSDNSGWSDQVELEPEDRRSVPVRSASRTSAACSPSTGRRCTTTIRARRSTSARTGSASIGARAVPEARRAEADVRGARRRRHRHRARERRRDDPRPTFTRRDTDVGFGVRGRRRRVVQRSASVADRRRGRAADRRATRTTATNNDRHHVRLHELRRRPDVRRAPRTKYATSCSRAWRPVGRPRSSSSTSLGSGNQRSSSKSAVRGRLLDRRACANSSARRRDDPLAPRRGSRAAPTRARSTWRERYSILPVRYETSPSRITSVALCAAVAPLAGVGIEAVVRQQAPALVRDQVDRVEDELELRLRQEVVEVDAHPARLDALAAAHDLALELLAGLDVDAEQAMAVRARRSRSRRATGCRTDR